MKKKHIVLIVLIALGLFRLFNKDGDISVFDIVMNIAVTALIWGIFIWGYNNPEAKR